ncbi:MAG: DUF1844 domain-containing protein [Nitrospiraceae bacterium]|nr:DUF1844 domain-containing protein [Nitrospiraceae bacterium]
MEERFEIRDKRRLDAEGNVKGQQPQSQPKAAPEEKAVRQGPAASGPSIFVPFLMNIAGMAYMAMGLGEMPAEPNLPEARYIIDAIAMLEEKTKGNLTPEEDKALKELLYELRMNFAKVVSAAGKG